MSVRRHRTRSIITRLAVFLLLGSAVNVAVAWGLALWSPSINEQYKQFTADKKIEYIVDSGLGFCRVTHVIGGGFIWGHRHHDPSGVGGAAMFNRSNQRSEAGEMRLRRWGPRAAQPDIERGLVLNDVRGWPFLSMRSHSRLIPEGTGFLKGLEKHVQHGIDVDRAVSYVRGTDDVRVVPFRIIWPGFAINTLFYAAILCLLFAAPGSVRRWRRVRRGLCAKCAYPVGASDVCTECGATVR